MKSRLHHVLFFFFLLHSITLQSGLISRPATATANRIIQGTGPDIVFETLPGLVLDLTRDPCLIFLLGDFLGE